MVITCAGCNQSIKEKFLMRVNGRPWHPSCLQCSSCKTTLSETCFQKNGLLYCKSDFFKFFGTKCAGCGLGISPHDLVRKSRTDRVYHVPCFVCSVCRKEVATGEELFILENDKVLCKEDFFSHGRQRINRSTKKPLKDSSVDQINAPSEQSPLVVLSQPFEKQESCRSQDIDEEEEESQCCPSLLPQSKQSDNEEYVVEPPRVTDNLKNDTIHVQANDDLKKNFLDQSDDESLAESISSSTSFSSIALRETAKKNDSDLKLGDAFASENTTSNRRMFTSGGQVGISLMGSNLPGGAGAKRRGPRTTIKAKQLETLKAAFAATPKPTRHIREQLARDTGLNMRVIQVWFQNRRSKERRMKQMSVFGPVRRHQFLRSPRRVRSILMSSTSHLREHSSDREVIMSGGKIFYENQNCDPDFFRSGFYPQYSMSPSQHPHGELFGTDCQLIPPSMSLDSSDILPSIRQRSVSSEDIFPQCFQHCL